MSLVFYGKQFIDKSDINEVIKSLKNNLITTGPYVKKFERNLSVKFSAPYAITCSSGTAALHLAFMAINLSKNDIIILPSINFVAAANMALELGAKIYFADINSKTGQVTYDSIKECINKNRIKKVKAILTMYHGGYPRNIGDFFKLKKKYNCYLIEDSCHALGAKYFYGKKKFMIGSCRHSDISTFSLHPVKSITSGEGGVVTTRNKKIAKKVILLRSHGIERDKKKYWNYNIKTSGFNYRLSDINSALGNSQLKKLDKFMKKRKEIFDLYNDELNDFKDICSLIKPEIKTHSSYHLALLNINFEKLKKNKNDLINFFLKNQIVTQYHYIPFYKFTKFKKEFKYHKNKFKGSKIFFLNVLSIPIYFELKNYQILRITRLLKKFIKLNLK